MLKVSLITEVDTKLWEVGKKVLSAFTEISPLLTPEVLFQWENKISDFHSVDECKSYWAQTAIMQAANAKVEIPIGLRWKNKGSAKYDAEISHAYMNVKGDLINGSLKISAKLHRRVDWLVVFKELCLAIKPDIAIMHFFSGPELKKTSVGTHESYFLSGVVCNGKIPNIGWAMFYGDGFSQEVNAEKILAAGFCVESLGGGCLVRVTDDINDVVSNFSGFSKRRSELKGLFREGLFMIGDEPVA